MTYIEKTHIPIDFPIEYYEVRNHNNEYERRYRQFADANPDPDSIAMNTAMIDDLYDRFTKFTP